MKNIITLILIILSTVVYSQITEIQKPDDNPLSFVGLDGAYNGEIYFTTLNTQLPIWKKEFWKINSDDNIINVPISNDPSVNGIDVVYSSGDELFVWINESTGSSLIRYKDNTRSIVLDDNNNPIRYASEFIAYNGLQYFVSKDESDRFFRSYDGNVITRPDIAYPEGGFLGIEILTTYKNELYFIGWTNLGRQIWKFDGDSVTAVSDIGIYPEDEIVNYKDELYFVQEYRDQFGIGEKYELIRFDGQNFSTVATERRRFYNLVAYKDILCFNKFVPEEGYFRFHKFDGNAITEFSNEGINYTIERPTVFQDKLFYFAEEVDKVVFKSFDGIVEKNIGEFSPYPNDPIIVLNDSMYFYQMGGQGTIWKYKEASCDIHPGDLKLESQEDIDTFNYCEVAGSLTIEELVTGDIVDLSPLNVLENLGGDLKIYRNKALTQINGFQNLTAINGTLELRGNTLVTNIDGLSNITALQRLELFNNFKLENIDALSNITTLTDVRITNNNLANLYGVRNLETITNILYLNNTKLLNLDDLSNLQTIAKAMYLYSNSTLENVDGLQNMVVDNAIHINNNVALKNLDGLNKVLSLSKDFVLKNNKGLENACGIKQLLAENAVGGTIEISMNGPNASSINAIMNSCLPSLGLVMYPTVGYGNHMIVEGIKAPSFTYMIHNLSGILLEQGTISNANDINTVIFRNVLGSGNYIFTVEESGQRTSVQFVVQF
ncbi:hypothetical protein [uncultured Aquimarina sp.]|uniref:hypothetical protein n=1 Tax=uncultured Aquimarina sp. TaxID=575652 RepID=UPI0026256775|nr:hypothetical protein [uncultured Aquimarina sp.]